MKPLSLNVAMVNRGKVKFDNKFILELIPNVWKWKYNVLGKKVMGN